MAENKIKLRPLAEQVIVITGATSGIGLATAEMAAERGASVVLSSRNEEDLEQIIQRLQSAGYKARGVNADVCKMTDLENLAQVAIETFGRIDTWVNNAGGSIYGPLLEIPEEEERALFDVNFWGVRNGCRVAFQHMKENGGAIINLGSEVSVRSLPLQGMYSATKHAVKAYTDALRMELEHDGYPISVSLIRPTAINTPFAEHAVNHLRSGEPSLPDPIYHPDYVAEAILKCATDVIRDVFVGGPSKMSAVMEFIMPGMTDKHMEKSSYKDQSAGESIPHEEGQEGLHHAPAHEGNVFGHHKGKKTKQRSDMKTPEAKH
ncbi:SDR family oxidoreductase [Bdellovibrio sp. HCB2-146]|uniref:SDR family oxidoreductase n=1 Tax=Bdellovibrio sp. HCB2-146 TaxID=3394362 RepID=UPI0039BC7840